MTHRRALPIPPRVGSMGVFWVTSRGVFPKYGRNLLKEFLQDISDLIMEILQISPEYIYMIMVIQNFSKFLFFVMSIFYHILSTESTWLQDDKKYGEIYQYGIIWTCWWKYHVHTLRRQWKWWELYCRGIQLYISQMSELFSLLNHQSKNYVMVIFDWIIK